MKKVLVCAVVLTLVGAGVSWARLGGAGTQFLAIGGGARSLALGGAVSGMSGDLESVYWNPAGIAFLEGTAVGFTHTMLYADMSLEDVAVATPAMDGVVGISGLGFLSGDIEETTEEMPDGTGETFTANAFSLGLTYARLMTDKFAAGVSFRFVREGLGEVSASNWGFDLGGTYRVGFGNLRLGFAVVNFGPDMQLGGDRLEAEWVNPDWEDTQDEDVPVLLQSEAYPMPMTFRAGLSYDVFSGASGMVTASLEGIHPVDQDEALGAGLQYSYGDRYFLRAGYNTINNMQWAAGGGVRIPTGSVEMCVDYCFQDHEYLDPIHRVAVGFIPRG
jgi:hypothetical protein